MNGKKKKIKKEFRKKKTRKDEKKANTKKDQQGGENPHQPPVEHLSKTPPS